MAATVVKLRDSRPTTASVTFRPVQPMSFPATELSGTPDWRPEFAWVSTTALLVDDTYQRNLKPTSVRLIRKIAREFNWAHLKPPVVVRVGATYHIINGQHTAIAAATIGIPELPVFIVRAERLADRAQAFVSHNTDNIKITRLDIHRASVAAGDPTACEIDRICRESGIHLRDMGDYAGRVGDTKSVASLYKGVKVYGAPRLREALTALVRAKRGAISEYEIKAACALAAELKDTQRLYLAIRAGGDDDVAQCRMDGFRQKRSAWLCLLDLWRKRV